jgi:hypothetical protein
LIIGAYPINAGINCFEVFKGNVDDVRIYNRELIQSEINYLSTHKNISNPGGYETKNHSLI